MIMPMIPNAGEAEKDFMSRCMSHTLEGKDMAPEQATAICASMWKKSQTKKFDIQGRSDIIDSTLSPGFMTRPTKEDNE
jgi:hypothetical protein